ncbi:unnamed protein product [Closterium sp. NIES-54]
MSLCSSPPCVSPPPLPSPSQLSLTIFPHPFSDFLCTTRPTISRVLSSLVTHLTSPPLSDSALVTAVTEFASSHRVEYATQLFADTLCPLSVRVNNMWIFKQEWIYFFHTFSPTPKMTTLQLLLHIAAHVDYELHSLNTSTAFLRGSLHEQIWLRRPPNKTGSIRPGTKWSLRRSIYGLHQAPHEWHDTLRTTLAALFFSPPSAYGSCCTLLLYVRLLMTVLSPSALAPRPSIPLFTSTTSSTPDRAALDSVKAELQRSHTCTDLGDLRWLANPPG